MHGLDHDLVMHLSIVTPSTNPVKQKLRKMHPRVELLAKVEHEKILDVSFIRPIDYAKWISNLVLVGKPDGNIKYAQTLEKTRLVPRMTFCFLTLI